MMVKDSSKKIINKFSNSKIKSSFYSASLFEKSSGFRVKNKITKAIAVGAAKAGKPKAAARALKVHVKAAPLNSASFSSYPVSGADWMCLLRSWIDDVCHCW